MDLHYGDVSLACIEENGAWPCIKEEEDDTSS